MGKRKAKVAMWGLIAFVVSLTVTGIMTGSFLQGLGVALVMRTVKTVLLFQWDRFFDESVWPWLEARNLVLKEVPSV